MDTCFGPDSDALSQVIIAIVIGMLLSCVGNSSIMLLIMFSIVLEIAYYCYYCPNMIYKWSIFVRAGVFFGYIYGFIIARTVYDKDFCFFSEDVDVKYGLL